MPARDRRDDRLILRAHAYEKEAWARSAGGTRQMSEWARNQLNRAAGLAAAQDQGDLKPPPVGAPAPRRVEPPATNPAKEQPAARPTRPRRAAIQDEMAVDTTATCRHKLHSCRICKTGRFAPT